MATDIDLLIALSGSERVTGQLGSVTSNLATLKTQGLQAMQGVRGLSSAFDAMSGSGKLSAESIVQMTNLLPLLSAAGPAGLAIAGLGTLALQLHKANDAADRKEMEEQAKRIKQVEEAAKDATTGLRAFQKAIAEGSTREEADLAAKRAQLAKDTENTAKESQDNITRLMGELEDLRARQRKLRSEMPATQEDLVRHVLTLEEVETSIRDTAFAIANVVVAEDQFYESAGDANRALDDQTTILTKWMTDSERATAITRALAAAEGMVADEVARTARAEEARADALLRAQMIVAERDPEDRMRRARALAKQKAAGAPEDFDAMAAAQQRLGMMTQQALGELGAAAFDQYANAMERVIDGQNAFGKNSGRAMQNAASATLKSLGQQSAAMAVMHLAMAAAGATGGWFPTAQYGTPTANLKAAALFGSVAVLAGVGGAALSVKPASGGGGGGSGGGDRGGGSGSGGGPNVSVTVIGNLDDAAANDLGRRIAQAMARGDA